MAIELGASGTTQEVDEDFVRSVELLSPSLGFKLYPFYKKGGFNIYLGGRTTFDQITLVTQYEDDYYIDSEYEMETIGSDYFIGALVPLGKSVSIDLRATYQIKQFMLLNGNDEDDVLYDHDQASLLLTAGLKF